MFFSEHFNRSVFFPLIYFDFFFCNTRQIATARTITLYCPFFLSCPLDFMLSFNGRTQRKRDHVLYIFFINHSPPSPLSLSVCVRLCKHQHCPETSVVIKTGVCILLESAFFGESWSDREGSCAAEKGHAPLADSLSTPLFIVTSLIKLKLYVQRLLVFSLSLVCFGLLSR